MGEHDPLREAGRPARVGQRHQVCPGIDRYGWDGVAPLQQVRKRRGPSRLAEDENFLHRRLACGLECMVEEFGNRNQVLRLSVVELQRELPRRRQRIGGRGDPAEGGDRMQGHRVFEHIRAVDREDVAFSKPAAREVSGDLADRRGQIRVGERAPGRPVDQRRLASQGGGPGEHESR